jgi:hypothetical protein
MPHISFGITAGSNPDQDIHALGRYLRRSQHIKTPTRIVTKARTLGLSLSRQPSDWRISRCMETGLPDILRVANRYETGPPGYVNDLPGNEPKTLPIIILNGIFFIKSGLHYPSDRQTLPNIHAFPSSNP